MSRYYLLLGFMFCPLFAMAQNADVAPTSFGYESVQQAFDALEADPDANRSEYQGWTLFKQKDGDRYILWSFTPPDHPVHPSAVRREIVNQDGKLFIGMAVLCHSSRFDCDQLVEQFQQINESLKQKYTADPD